MPKRMGMKGPGSMAMGGGGKKPRIPQSTMMGTPPVPASMGGMGTGAGPGMMGPRAAPGAGVKAFKHGGEAKREEHKKHAHGGPVNKPTHSDEAQDRKLFHKMEKEEGKEKVSKHAHGGPVIAGHTTHGMPGKEHPKEQGISKGADSRRGGVKGAGLDPISSQMSNAKARVGMHKKAS